MNTSKRTEQFKYAEKQKSTISNKSAKNANNSYRQTNVCFCTRNTPETNKKKRKREKQENFGPQCLQGNGGLSHRNCTYRTMNLNGPVETK